MPTIVTGHVSRDELGYRPLPTPIGPFPGSTEARRFMESLGPLWGSWGIENLGSPDLADYGVSATQDRGADV